MIDESFKPMNFDMVIVTIILYDSDLLSVSLSV